MSIGQFMPFSPIGSFNLKDPNALNVIMALPMENNGDGNSVVDESIFQNTFTRGGNPVITDVEKQFGTSSLYFDGVGDYYFSGNKAVFNQPDVFTIELWINYQNNAPNGYIVSHATDWEYDEPSLKVVPATGKVHLRINKNDSAIVGITVLPQNVWHHISYGRINGRYYLYANGILQGSVAVTTSLVGWSCTLGTHGAARNTGTADHYKGYIDEFRWWKGVSLRDGVANFTPPKAPWEPIKPASTIFKPIEILSGGSATEAGYNTPTNWGSISAEPFDGYPMERCAGKKDSTFGIWMNIIRLPGPHSPIDFDRFTQLVPTLRLRRGTLVKNLRPFTRTTGGLIYIQSGLDGGEVMFVPGEVTYLEQVP